VNPYRSIKVCLASPHFFPTHGGAQLRFLRYVSGLSARGVFVEVFAGTPKAKEAANTRVDMAQSWHVNDPISKVHLRGEPSAVQVHRTRLPDGAGPFRDFRVWWRSVAFSRALLRFCGDAGRRPDVIQMIPSLQPRAIPWLRALRRRLGIPIVYGYTIFADLSAHPFRWAFRRWALRRLYHEVDCIVVGSTVLEEYLRDFGVRTRIEVIPNGVNLKRFRPVADEIERTECRTALGFKADQKIITFVGSVIPRKGADLLLEAWVRLSSRLPTAHLLVLGARADLGQPKLTLFARRLEDLVATSGCPERVHFLGLVDNVEDYLRASDVFVCTSRREGTPNTVLEAMASGLPVVMCPFLRLPHEFGRSGREYLLVDHDPDLIASGIATILGNGDLGAALGRQARSWMEKTMDVERSLEQYAAIYHGLATRSAVLGAS
jgi:glycosyltransferase involved in cell wall biosynthesis